MPEWKYVAEILGLRKALPLVCSLPSPHLLLDYACWLVSFAAIRALLLGHLLRVRVGMSSSLLADVRLHMAAEYGFFRVVENWIMVVSQTGPSILLAHWYDTQGSLDTNYVSRN